MKYWKVAPNQNDRCYDHNASGVSKPKYEELAGIAFNRDNLGPIKAGLNKK
jgi:hypothetical protein